MTNRCFATLVLLVFGLMTSMAHAAKNELTWTVQDEKDVFGYIVYRADQRAGPFLRASSKIIRKRFGQESKPDASYTYVDDKVKPGATYYYFIDVIAINGRKQRLSGVLSKKVPEL